MSLCIIPARGGSKRIPRKNVRDFCGKPMIAWSIQTALDSGCFDEVIVSTDDTEIADIARSWGATVPFMRPAELADDHTGTIAVVRNAIERMRDLGRSHGLACCVYATAPFLQPGDLRSGRDTMAKEECDFAFTVTKYPFPIQRAIRVTSFNRVEMFYPTMFSRRSQDLEEAWHDAGQMYWGRVDAWMSAETVFANRSVPIILPRYRVQDIDTPEDWIRAELMFRAIVHERSHPD